MDGGLQPGTSPADQGVAPGKIRREIRRPSGKIRARLLCAVSAGARDRQPGLRNAQSAPATRYAGKLSRNLRRAGGKHQGAAKGVKVSSAGIAGVFGIWYCGWPFFCVGDRHDQIPNTEYQVPSTCYLLFAICYLLLSINSPFTLPQCSVSSRSSGPKAARKWLSISSSPTTFLFTNTGTTISDLVSMEQAR